MLLAQSTPTQLPSAKAQSKSVLFTAPASRTRDAPLAESVVQEIRVEEKFALATVKIRWLATKNQLLPVLYEPAVLTRITYPTNAL